MEAGPKKSWVVSHEFINTTGKETEAESQPVSKPKLKTKVYVGIAMKPPSEL